MGILSFLTEVLVVVDSIVVVFASVVVVDSVVVCLVQCLQVKLGADSI
jgi:hypothetical protein